MTKYNSVAIWADSDGEFILIGNEYCEENDLIIRVNLTQDNILAWIKVLVAMLEDGDIKDVPGSIEKCAVE